MECLFHVSVDNVKARYRLLEGAIHADKHASSATCVFHSRQTPDKCSSLAKLFFQPTFSVTCSVWNDVNDVFFAIRGVDVALRELVSAEPVGRRPSFLLPSKKFVRVTLAVPWHVVHDYVFKPVNFIQQINYDSAKVLLHLLPLQSVTSTSTCSHRDINARCKITSMSMEVDSV